MMQAYLVAYASNGALSTGEMIETPEQMYPQENVRKAAVQQCKEQFIRTSDQVQSFSGLGLVIVFVATLVLMLMAWLLDDCVGCAQRKRNIHDQTNFRRTARQLDDPLHLQRMALGNHWQDGDYWSNGPFDVPILNNDENISRPKVSGRTLAWYKYELQNIHKEAVRSSLSSNRSRASEGELIQLNPGTAHPNDSPARAEENNPSEQGGTNAAPEEARPLLHADSTNHLATTSTSYGNLHLNNHHYHHGPESPSSGYHYITS
jgi:hypothetical protein